MSVVLPQRIQGLVVGLRGEEGGFFQGALFFGGRGVAAEEVVVFLLAVLLAEEIFCALALRVVVG